MAEVSLDFTGCKQFSSLHSPFIKAYLKIKINATQIFKFPLTLTFKTTSQHRTTGGLFVPYFYIC